MRLLVTGGLGFIGSNFVRYVLSKYREASVLNVDKMGIGSNPLNLVDFRDDPRYRLVVGDVADLDLMVRLVKGVDAVVNFAAETHVDRSIADPTSFVRSNFLGVFAILEALRRVDGDVKFVQVSTDEVYGDIGVGSFCEDDRLKPSNPYSATKASADMLVFAYHRTYGVRGVVARCVNNFGPFQFPEKLIPKTVIRALKALPVPIYGSGLNKRDWIYVLDFCEAVDLVLREGVEGEVYNVSAGNELSNLDVVKMVLDLMGKPRDLITFVADRPGHDLRYSLDSSKFRVRFGWRPKHTFSDALRETVNWYLANEWWWRDLATDVTLHPTPWELSGGSR